MIRIIRKSFQEELVDEHLLDSLILADKLIAFNRSGTWAIVGKDAVRQQNTYYQDAERRKITYGNEFCMR